MIASRTPVRTVFAIAVGLLVCVAFWVAIGRFHNSIGRGLDTIVRSWIIYAFIAVLAVFALFPSIWPFVNNAKFGRAQHVWRNRRTTRTTLNVAVEMETPRISWAPIAQRTMEQLPESEEAKVRSCVNDLARWFDPGCVTFIDPTREGQVPVLVVNATLLLRVLLVRVGNGFRVIEVIDATRLAA